MVVVNTNENGKKADAVQMVFQTEIGDENILI